MSVFALVTLSDFFGSIGAEHTYSRVTLLVDRKQTESKVMKYVPTPEQIKVLEEKDDMIMYPDDDGVIRTGRYNSSAEAKLVSMDYIKEVWPYASLILSGDSVTRPVECLFSYDVTLKEKMNKLYTEHEECYATTNDPWSIGLGDKLDSILVEWDKLIAEAGE